MAAGVSRYEVRQRVSTGWVVRRYRGVYLVGPLRIPLTEPMAAVLALGDGALLSHYPAGVLWSLRPATEEPMHLTVSARDARGPAGIKVHRASELDPADRTSRHQIPITSPARTLLDLAAYLPQRDLDRATDEARVHHLVTDHSLNEQFRRYPHHRGTAALRKAIQTEPALTRSEAERTFLELVRAARLPEPEVNARVGLYEVDFFWRDRNLIVEVDGYAFHSSRSSFERDRRRDAELQAAGCRVLRLTWRGVTGERELTVATVTRALAV